MGSKKSKLDLSPTILDLPNEILLKIFSYLPQSDHYAVGLVPKRFRKLIDNTKWWDKESPALLINDENVREVKEAIENKTNKLCFKRVKIEKVSRIEDLEYILQSIGKEIQELSMLRTAAFHLLKDNVVNLKSIDIYFDGALENSIDNGSFNLCYFPLLEGLSFMDTNGWDMNSIIIKLLEQLKSPENTLSLKHFQLRCDCRTEDYFVDSLLHNSSTLESLTIYYFSNVNNFTNWMILFSRLKNIKKLCFSGHYTREMMNAIFSAHPKETPLEHLEFNVDYDFDHNEIFPLIVKKWRNSLQFLKLSNFMNLTDDAAKELGKLAKLRLLKLINCYKITKMGFLAGIAKKPNIYMDELHLQNIPKLDEEGLGVIISRFPNLRVLTLHNLGNAITNTSLQSIWRFSTRLRSLTIDCRNMTDEGMIGSGNHEYSINRLRLLVKLQLVYCDSLTDRTLIEGLKLPALRSLELYNCPKITLQGIESLVNACSLLEILGLSWHVFMNENVFNDDALFVIGHGFKHLRQLNITDSVYLTEINRDHIKDVFATLQDSVTNSTFHPDCKLQFMYFL